MTIAVDLGRKVTSKHIVIVSMTFFFHGYNFLVGCEYGDKQTWCSTLTRSQCYLNADMCCGFCNRPDIKDTNNPGILTLNAPITTKVVCFSRLLKCLKSIYGKHVDPDQTAPIGAVCSGSTLFASILNCSVMLGNYLQQTTFSDAFFSWRFLC